MPRDRKPLYKILCAAVFIILEIAAFAMFRNSGALQNIWISRLSHKIMTATWGSSESISEYFHLKELNNALAEENFLLQEELHQYRLADEEREKIVDENFEFIPAKIIKISRNKAHNYIIIDKGYEDGVFAQSGLITSNGVVGIIDVVEKHYSFALSLMNSEVSVSARIGDGGGVGPLYWDGKNTNGAILKEIPLHHKFNLGDTVMTSGFSSIFPGDIPLGIITGSKVINGATNECSIELLQDFSALKYVTVVNNLGRDEILNLENMAGASE